MSRKSYWQRKKEQRIAASRIAIAARERKRLAESVALVECGGLLTWRSLGNHDVRLLAYPGDVQRVAVTFDGRHRRPRTLRGVWQCVAKMIAG